MTVDRYVRLFAGALVVMSLALGATGSPLFQNAHWLWFTGFIGFMMAQSALTGFCPMGTILKALGVKEGCEARTSGA
jgi:hypothetical protein